MTTFDEILPKLAAIFQRHPDVASIAPILVNRDLNGRVRLIMDEKWETNPAARAELDAIAREARDALGPHAHSAEQMLMFEPNIEGSITEESAFPLEDCAGINVVDRLAMEGDWAKITPPLTTAQRIVFFSIKGGVGRSTALAATAWVLAERGERVLVLDMDLESPGLSSSLLPQDRRPAYGIADWLVEDLVDNSELVFADMVATSELSRNGDILVVPAHGKDPGEYLSKLGRVWMSKAGRNGQRESWPERLRRLLDRVEERWRPSVVLIDSRAGIDEAASACLTGLGASTILLFAIDGDQTWTGYRMLFRHWRKAGRVREIRERLQIVGAMIPETGADKYFEELRERAWDAFADELYDEIPAGAILSEGDSWSFDQSDESAPHYPWAVRWHRGFAALQSLHGKLSVIGRDEINAVFGPLIEGVMASVEIDRDAV
ncbi:MAG: AAA family ATPase [Magnetospirillum sp.]|nr:AAA family ATPase [Magnetospirillum sp.]